MGRSGAPKGKRNIGHNAGNKATRTLESNRHDQLHPLCNCFACFWSFPHSSSLTRYMPPSFGDLLRHFPNVNMEKQSALNLRFIPTPLLFTFHFNDDIFCHSSIKRPFLVFVCFLSWAHLWEFGIQSIQHWLSMVTFWVIFQI